MSDLNDEVHDDKDLEQHQLPIEDIVTAVDGQDPQTFLAAMANMLDPNNK